MFKQLALGALQAAARRLELRESRLYVVRHLGLGLCYLSLLGGEIGPRLDDLALEAIENRRRQSQPEAEGRRVDRALVCTLAADAGGKIDVGKTQALAGSYGLFGAVALDTSADQIRALLASDI